MNDFLYLDATKMYDSKKVIETCYKILISGLTKSGKTYFGGTAPNPYIIDTDGSLNGLPEEMKNIPYTSIRVGDTSKDKWTMFVGDKELPFAPFDYVTGIIKDLMRCNCILPDGYKVETIVIDGISKLSSLIVWECQLDNKIKGDKETSGYRNPINTKPMWPEYSTLATRLNLIYNLIDNLGINIVTTSHLQIDKDDISGKIQCFPDVIGSFRKEIGSRHDAALLAVKDGNKHFIHTDEFNKFSGGARRWTGPTTIENPTWDKIKNYIKG